MMASTASAASAATRGDTDLFVSAGLQPRSAPSLHRVARRGFRQHHFALLLVHRDRQYKNHQTVFGVFRKSVELIRVYSRPFAVANR